MDDVLKSLGIDTNGLSYDDMTTEEKKTLNVWLAEIERDELTIGRVREHIQLMREAVDMELSKTNISNKEDTLLKARLRNYILLEAFLSGPEKAKKALKNSISNLRT